jgi:hypothetical protein
VRAWTPKRVAILVVVGVISLAYLARAVTSFGAWAGVPFAVLRIAVFVYYKEPIKVTNLEERLRGAERACA